MAAKKLPNLANNHQQNTQGTCLTIAFEGSRTSKEKQSFRWVEFIAREALSQRLCI